MVTRRWPGIGILVLALAAGLAADTPRVLGASGPVGLLAVTRPAAQEPPGGLRPNQTRRLAVGRLLVADRGLVDPNFVETVVLLIETSPDGWAGLVLNRPTPVPVATLFETLGLAPDAGVPAYSGGPVGRTGALGLVRTTDAIDDTSPVVAGVRLVSSRVVMERLVRTEGPDRFRVYLGYAGWTAGQLERESTTGAWYVLDADARTVFDDDLPTLWQRQMSRTSLRQAMRAQPRRLAATAPM